MRKLTMIILMIGCTSSYGYGVDYTSDSEKPVTRGEFESYKNDLEHDQSFQKIMDDAEEAQRRLRQSVGDYAR